MQNVNTVNKKERLSIGESSEYLGVSIDTLRRWDKKGVITTYRSPGGHRYFLKTDLDKLFGQKYTRTKETKSSELTGDRKIEESPQPKVETQKTPQTQTNTLIPPSIENQQSQEEIQHSNLQQKSKKIDVSWTTIFIIGLVIFIIIDLVLLIIYFTSTRTLITPIP